MSLFKSTFADSEPPGELRNSLAKFYWNQLDKFANKTLFVDFETQTEWTGAQIKQVASTIAANLVHNFDLKRGNICLFFYPNSDLIHLVALGVIFAGGAVCAGSADDPERERRYMIDTLAPRLIFYDGKLAREMHSLRQVQAYEELPVVMMNDNEMRFAHQLDASRHSYGLHTHLLNSNGAGRNEIKLPAYVEADDAAYILLTSGSTGHPKPVARTHKNSLYVCYSFMSEQVGEKLWRLDEDCVFAGHLPLDHGTGTFSIKMTLAKGLKLIIMKDFNQTHLLQAIERHRVTDCLLGSALAHNMMLDRSWQFDISSLRNLLTVGSPLPSGQLASQFMDCHPHLSVRQTFGMTEFGFLSIVARDSARQSFHLVGMLLPNIKVKLVDPSSTLDPTDAKLIHRFNQDGELYVSGPTLSPGYLGKKFVTQSEQLFLDDGFYRTSDLARFTSNMELQLRGRLKEMLCFTDGWKVLPYEIESTLLEHPAIAEAAVVGMPHPTLRTCHVARAFIVLKESLGTGSGGVSERQVYEFAAERLSGPKHLDGGVVFMEKLPRISVGKVDKQALLKLSTRQTTTIQASDRIELN